MCRDDIVLQDREAAWFRALLQFKSFWVLEKSKQSRWLGSRGGREGEKVENNY